MWILPVSCSAPCLVLCFCASSHSENDQNSRYHPVWGKWDHWNRTCSEEHLSIYPANSGCTTCHVAAASTYLWAGIREMQMLRVSAGHKSSSSEFTNAHENETAIFTDPWSPPESPWDPRVKSHSWYPQEPKPNRQWRLVMARMTIVLIVPVWQSCLRHWTWPCSTCTTLDPPTFVSYYTGTPWYK